jgi:hypothetical protein
MMSFIKKLKTYKIKKGKFYSSGLHLDIVLKNKISFEVSFDASCLESIPLPDNYDINKVYGFSDSYSHHKYSARVGWRCVDITEGKIELVTYCYVNGIRIPEFTLCKVLPGQIAKITIENTPYSYNFTCDNGDILTSNKVVKDKAHRWFLKYKLYPYHGGTYPAPHDMKIMITKI